MVVHTATAADTETLGAQLAGARPGQEGLAHGSSGLFGVIYLTGDLGSGKTTLTRGFLQALGVQAPVRSPTYTLVEIYEVGDVTAVHLDLYRLSDPSELDNLGLREWAKAGHIWLVEWPERGTDRLPEADLVVRLAAGEGGPDIELSAHSASGSLWLERLRQQLKTAPRTA